MSTEVQAAHEQIIAAAEALSCAMGAADLVLAGEADDAEVPAGAEPYWWNHRFGELSVNHDRLVKLKIEGGWESRLLSADVVREISVVRRYLVRMGHLANADVLHFVDKAIVHLDAALAAFGLCALSLREATYLQTIYEAATVAA